MPTFQLKINIKNRERVERAVRKAPKDAAKYLSDAINTSLFIIQGHSQNKSLLKFKRPTGLTRKTFKHGTILSTPRSLRGSIGPTTHYAVYVHEGTRRGITPNPFMERLLKVSSREVDKAFNRQMDMFMKSIRF